MKMMASVSSSIKYEKAVCLAYFLVLLATWPLYFIGSFSSLWSFIFTQIFPNWKFFFYISFLIQSYHLLHSLRWVFEICVMFDLLKEHTFEGFFSLWFAYHFPLRERTFHLFFCLGEFRFPVDYYKRKMDQVISNVKEFYIYYLKNKLMYVLYFLVFLCKIHAH